MLRYAILSHLASRRLTGYELSSILDNDRGSTWQASRSQVYGELARLESEGLVSGRVVEQRTRPDKTEYRILAAGRAALLEWVESAVQLAPTRDPAHVRAVNFGRIDPYVALDKIRETVAQYRQRVDALRVMSDSVRARGVSVDEWSEHSGWALSIEVAIRTYEGTIAAWEWAARKVEARGRTRADTGTRR